MDAVKLVGYARLSKANGNGLGLDVQRQAIEQHAAQHGHELLRIEEDDGASGATTKKRPGFAAALDACREGSAQGIISAALDRITRSLLDFANLVEDARKYGYAVIVVKESFDLSTSSGEAMAGMLAVFSAWERRTISARSRAAVALVKERTPEDLERLSKERGREVKAIGNRDPSWRAPAKLEQRVRRMRADGMTLRAIAEALDEDGTPTLRSGKRWHPQTVSDIAKRGDDS